MFDVERLKTIDADLAGAQQGDRDAQLRLMNFHVPWLLVFARTVNDRIEQGFYALDWEKTSDALEVDADSGKADPVVGEPEEQPTSEVENENVEDASEDASEGSENVEGGSEDAPEAEEEHVKVREGDPVSSSEPQLEPHQVVVPSDYVMEEELYEAAGGVFFEPGFTPEGGYTAPWLVDEDATPEFEDPEAKDNEDLEVLENNGEAE